MWRVDLFVGMYEEVPCEKGRWVGTEVDGWKMIKDEE